MRRPPLGETGVTGEEEARVLKERCPSFLRSPSLTEKDMMRDRAPRSGGGEEISSLGRLVAGSITEKKQQVRRTIREKLPR